MATIPSFAYFQGKIVPYGEAKVGVMTHALNYGTGCFGGIRGYWNDDDTGKDNINGHGTDVH